MSSSTQSTSQAGPSEPHGTPLSPTDPTPAFERWRSSLARFTGMGAKPEGSQSETEPQATRAQLEASWNKCEKWKNALMTRSPMITFMLKHLELSGCPFTSDSIQCHPCPQTHAGGFSPEFGILLCQDRFFSKKHMEDTLAHELIHAFDHCKFDVDWSNLRHQACSEIRAANLSGDCRWLREMRRGYYSFSKQHQTCVKRRAVLSLLGNPACKDREMAEKAVNEVWESCSRDTRPFDEIY